MSYVLDDLRSAWGLVRRDFLVAISYRTRFLSHLASIFFTLTLFHFISRLVRVPSFGSAEAYYTFAVIGLITLQVLNSTLGMPPALLRQEMVAGSFERLLVSPFGAIRGIAAMLLFPFLYALITALAMLMFAGLLFGVHLHWSTVPLVVPVGMLGALSFAPFGLLFLAVLLASKQSMTGASFVVAGISLISGLYFPVTLLPGWMRVLSEIQPFTPATDLMRHLMVGTPLHASWALELGKVVGFAALLLPLSVLAVRWALRRSRSGGTILEY
jgi:ABC-2 type transport system permease protein